MTRRGSDPPERVFLDANVLFSASYREESGLNRLWGLPHTTLLTSRHAVEEARRNLDERGRTRLAMLLDATEIVADVAGEALPADIERAEKDRPILAAALHANATRLLTGDRTHFGHLFGSRVHGTLIQRPADYHRNR